MNPRRLFALPRHLGAVCLFLLAGCGASSAARGPEAASAPLQAVISSPGVQAPLPLIESTEAEKIALKLRQGPSGQAEGPIPDCWLPLVRRLRNDPEAGPDMARYFRGLPAYSPAPMGAKVKELFTSAFLRRPKVVDDGKPKPPPSRIYRNVVTAAALQKCSAFLERYKSFFDAAEQKYPAPRNVLVSLLYLETRLGTYVGRENAFWSLACMAAADSPEGVGAGLSDIPITARHGEWLQAKLTEKSNWAYKELRALLQFCALQKLDPRDMPGSVYGAVGICQFMPSNLKPYGDDGDSDGVVNLFSAPDAIFSAASYLTKHGWRQGLPVASQRSVLKRYNNLNIYANTILALAESLRTGLVQTGPPDTEKPVAAPAKKPVAKKTAHAKKAVPGKKAAAPTKAAHAKKAAPGKKAAAPKDARRSDSTSR